MTHVERIVDNVNIGKTNFTNNTNLLVGQHSVESLILRKYEFVFS